MKTKKEIDKLTLVINDTIPNWVSVVCPELLVSGMGKNVDEALTACYRSIISTLSVMK